MMAGHIHHPVLPGSHPDPKGPERLPANVYQCDGWCYLMFAERGTGWNHGSLMARSRSLHGPYELDSRGSLLTTRDDFDWFELQEEIPPGRREH
jgi:beta-xylosidase